MKPEPFQIAIPDERLDDMRRRLRATRWAEDFGNAGWRYGVERGWLEDMVRYWAEDYDWRATEAEINRLPQYRVTIDGVPIHFIHIRGRGPSPTPIALSHGWPWTFWDWKDVIGPLSDPAAHGGDPADAFDVIVPSLPGFGFSTPLTTTGIDVAAVARLWIKLMQDVLGYGRFAAAGGDWGALITAQLGHAHADTVRGVYLSLPTAPGIDPFSLGPDAFADDEKWMHDRLVEILPHITSHIAVQTRDPQTLAYAMADSPAGTAAWLWERRRAWSDCGGDVVGRFGRDALCTLASIYWLTNTIGSSFRIYAEYFGNPWRVSHDRSPAIEAPTALAVLPKEVIMIPRAIMEKAANLKRHVVFPRGGHFGPAEVPELLVDEYRTFFRELR